MAQSRPPWLKLATRRDPQLQPVAQPARPIPTFSFLFGQASAPSKPAGPAPPSSAPPPAPAQIPGPSPTDPAPAPVASPPSPALRTTAPAPAPVASPPSPALRTTAPAPAPPPPEPEPAPPVQTAEVPISSIVSPWPPAVELPPLTLPPPSAEASLVPLPIPPPAPSPVVAPTPPPPELAAVPTPPAPSPVVAPTPPPPELAAVPTPPPPEAPELAPPATSAPLPTATTESPALPPVPAPAPPTTEGAPTLLPLSKEPQPLPQTEISQPPPPPTNQQTPAATGPPSPPSPPTSQPPRAAQPPPPPSSSPSAIPSPSPSPPAPAPSQRQQTLPPQLQSSQPTQAHHQPEPAPSPPLVELEPVPVLPPTRLHQRSEMSPPTFPGHPQLRKNKYRPLSIPSPSPPPILLTVSEPVRLKGEPIPHETMEQTNTVIHKRGPPPSQAGGPTVLPPHPPLFSRNTAESVMGANLRGNRTVPVQDMEDHGMITITIAGDNKGATMDLKLVGQKDQVTPNTGHHTQKKKEEAHVEEDGHESSKNEPVPHHKPVSAVVNSNVQSVNNSIVLGCHCDDNSPGVHLTLTGHKPNFKPRRGMKHELEHKEEHVSGLSSPEGHWTLAAP